MKTRVGFHWAMIRLLALIFAAHFVAAADAQIFASNRWLLIVETSRGMQRRAEAAQQIAASLAASGMNGQMQKGDTLGLWTFNDELHTGGFELHEWSPENARRIAGRIQEFLRTQKNERDGRIDRISGDLTELVKDSDFITVLVISEGTSGKLGTPYDDRIAANFKEWQNQQSRAQMPFITVLRGANGSFTDFLVNTPPFPLELPELPESRLPKAAPPVALTKPAPATSAPPTTLPPLILSGKKPEPVVTPPVEKPAEIAKTETPVEPVLTTPVHVPEPSTPSQRMEPVKTEPVQAPVSASQTPVAARTEPTPSSQGGPATELPSAEPTVAVSIAKESRPAWLWIGLGLGIGIGAAAALLLMRKRNHTPRASLITRSLDRDEK